ncbi:MAG TPA: peptidoglycan bridge formation glycyltransferase FemA/FemB family protein [Nocardioidaceae bacterium]|nr:peptidoglycan bridge formation glycyltransferase FemA/FemB family protein [Nocardioidaceae bacterium]
MNDAKLSVRTITPELHLSHIRSQRSTSFLQTPAWGEVKSDWRRESIGWYDESDDLVGVGLVLYRQLPKLKRYLAYLPEGPVIDWTSGKLTTWLTPMVEHLRGQHAFGVRMGPPVSLRRWTADAVKKGVADEAVTSLGQIPPSERSQVGAQVVSQLRELGWRPQAVDEGFAAGQPQFNFQIPLKTGGESRTEEEVLKGMNQQWRRNIKKADKAGVEVTRVQQQDLEPGLRDFWDLYVQTAERDSFTPRPLAYFSTMFRALLGEEPDRIRLYLARHEGDLAAATILVRVGGHAWYSYGASSTEKRDVRGSNAVQWAMISDSLADGADVYDLRGITETLDGDDPHIGLIQFKVGTGGDAVEYVGEWDLPIRSLVYKAFSLYMRVR